MSEKVHAPYLLASDGDREQVTLQLHRHVQSARLTVEELSDRVGKTLRARTFADLSAITKDLPQT
jgi:Domain of unknown function (DUF1707)